MGKCPFCNFKGDSMAKVVLENKHCIYMQFHNHNLKGKGIIIPKKHKETVFELSKEEWQATYDLLQNAKKILDKEFKPDGYNVGWNVGEVGGQSVFHAHLHVTPRYSDEPFKGKGINYWLKSSENTRKSSN
ncbi:MAG: HIT family protein [Firmicutes bacterium]|nr:HIT family protein [Bacillota bacterium]